MHPRRFAAGLALAVAALAVSVAPAHAQGKGKDRDNDKHYAVSSDDHAQDKGKHKDKHYAVSSDRAVTVTRNVLIRQGYDVVRIERVGATQVVYYRAGNRGRGRGKGPVQRMVIRTVERRVVFEDAPPAIMVDIDVNLKL
jgi:hypothetical protein